MIYTILIYLVFIFPLSFRAYRVDGNNRLGVKIFNSLFTLYMFVALAGNLKRSLFGVFNEDYLIIKQDYTTGMIFGLFYGIVSLFVVVQAIKLAMRKGDAIKYFLFSVPVIYLMELVHNYNHYISIYDKSPGTIYIILMVIFTLVIWGTIFMFYANKSIKAFFDKKANID